MTRRAAQMATRTRAGQVVTVAYSGRGVEGVFGVNVGQEVALAEAVQVCYTASGELTARVDRTAVRALAEAGVQIRLVRAQ